MLTVLPLDLSNIVCRYAFDATAAQTVKALAYILELKSRDLHPYTINEIVCDYVNEDREYLYSRELMDSSFFAPWRNTNPQPSPFREFFVWFSRSELWNTRIICSVIDNLDWRVARKLVFDLPFPVVRGRKQALMKWIINCPADGAIYCSELFRRITLNSLRLNPSTAARYIISDHCDSIVDWSKPPRVYPCPITF